MLDSHFGDLSNTDEKEITHINIRKEGRHTLKKKKIFPIVRGMKVLVRKGLNKWVRAGRSI